MRSLFLFLYVLLTLTSLIPAKGTKPPANFRCNTLDKPKPIDIIIETGWELYAGTDSVVPLLLRDSLDVMCTADDLDNPGNDHERNSIDHYILCCPQNFAKVNDTLNLLLLSHGRCQRYGAGNWFIERIEVRREGFLLFDYRFHTWIKGGLYGVSKMTSIRSKNEKPSYIFIHP
jgi:hypothetical protein